MESGLAISDATILAGSTRAEVTFDHGACRGVAYKWPDGFRFGSILDETCDEAKAERDAIRVRREWLERSRGS